MSRLLLALKVAFCIVVFGIALELLLAVALAIALLYLPFKIVFKGELT